MDFVASTLLAVAVAWCVLAWHQQTEALVVPFLDGSHHVANTANLANSLRAQGLSALTHAASKDPSTLLVYTILAVPALIVGDGRHAVAWVWVGCLALLLGALWYGLQTSARGPVRLLALALVLATGLWQSETGGAWDTRIDLLAACLVLVALVAAVRGSLFAAGLIGITASFAKGASLPLVVPLVGAAVLLGCFPLTWPGRRLPVFLVQAAVVIGLLVLFGVTLGPQAVAYNLMATGGSDGGDRVSRFLANVWGYLAADPLFYPRLLLGSYMVWPFLALPLVLVWGIARRWPGTLLRTGALALVACTYTYVLMTVSPLHSPVLAIWFLPGVVLAALFLAESAARTTPPWAVAIAAGFLAGVSVPTLHLAPEPIDAVYVDGRDGMFTQADAMARYLQQTSGTDATSVVLLDNFLSAHGPLMHNYDAYRVLIQERLRASQLTLDGWELGTYGLNWRTELAAQQAYPHVIFLIQENPMGIPIVNTPQLAGRSVYEGLGLLRSAHPDCFRDIAPPITLPHVGQQRAFALAETPECRAQVLTAAS